MTMVYPPYTTFPILGVNCLQDSFFLTIMDNGNDFVHDTGVRELKKKKF